MDLNQFTLYSMVSQCSDNNTLEKVLKAIEDFEKIHSPQIAKLYLKQFYNLKDSIDNFPLDNNCYISITEDTQIYTVTFRYEDKNISFHYQK